MGTWFSDPFGTDAANANPAGAGAFAYNLRFPGQVFDGVAGLHYNMARDNDPAIGRYVETDPIGLRGGMDPYVYAKDSPDMLVDPNGLFTLTEEVTYHYVNKIPGNRENQGAGTNPTVPGQCECSQCGGKCKLTGCRAKLLIDVALREGVADPAERNFYRQKEGDHVRDFLIGASRLRAAGQRAESDLQGDRFASQEECERRTWTYVAGEIQPVLQKLSDESHTRWDYFLGPHQWFSLRRYFGF